MVLARLCGRDEYEHCWLLLGVGGVGESFVRMVCGCRHVVGF
jgi:hypothetical protein